jgi:hypothetical protein
MTNDCMPCCPGMCDAAPLIEMVSSFEYTSPTHLLMDPCNTAAMASLSLSDILSLFTEGNEWKSWNHMAGFMSSGRYLKRKGFSHRSGHLISSPSAGAEGSDAVTSLHHRIDLPI